jgi:hypothetical protein
VMGSKACVSALFFPFPFSFIQGCA